MAKRLTHTVFVGGVAYGPASAVPADVAKKITNPSVWVEEDGTPEPVAGVVGDSSPAPAAGKDVPLPDGEATVKELRDYAKAAGITLGAAKAKPEILAVLGIGPDAADAGADPAADADGQSADADGAEADAAEDSDESGGDGPADGADES